MTGRETINLFLFLIVLMAVTVGCDKNASLWSQAQANGQNRVFSANLGGKTQRVVWTSVIGHPENRARHQAHQKGLQILGGGAYDVDVKIKHKDDGQCQVDMLMAVQ